MFVIIKIKNLYLDYRIKKTSKVFILRDTYFSYINRIHCITLYNVCITCKKFFSYTLYILGSFNDLHEYTIYEYLIEIECEIDTLCLSYGQ